uniref:Uncharacterized protein n=1 Tax=Rhizophora mucronata TaxID=61149 RepID=A0A2P2K6X2_RHIMU
MYQNSLSSHTCDSIKGLLHPKFGVTNTHKFRSNFLCTTDLPQKFANIRVEIHSLKVKIIDNCKY